MKTFLEEIRGKYVLPNMNKSMSYCMGTKNNCWSEISKGAKLHKYGKKIDVNAKCLILNPTISEIFNTNDLNFIPVDVKYLKIPLPLIKFLHKADTLTQLEILSIYNKEEYLSEKKNEDFNFNELGFSEKLKSLIFTGDCNKAGEYWGSLDFNISQFNNLEYLSSLLDKENKIIHRISKINNLKHLDIYGINSNEIFDYLSKLNVLSLSLSHILPQIDFKLISKCQNIEILQINDMKAVLDCRIFERFSNLVELSLLKVKKIINIEVLLNISTLMNLKIINSANPIKMNLKNKFASKGFEYLDIDYS